MGYQDTLLLSKKYGCPYIEIPAEFKIYIV